MAIFGGCDAKIHVVSVAEGKLRRRIEVGTYVPGSAALVDAEAYVGQQEGKVICAKVADGKVGGVTRKIMDAYGELLESECPPNSH